MCVTYCHRQSVLYWNHDPCSFEFCPFTVEDHGSCNSCRHRQDEICGLTRARLPDMGGCCHWNIELGTGLQPVTREMMDPLAIGPDPIRDVLDALEVSYETDEAGQVWVDPDLLSLPETYGLGTEDLAPDLWDWSEWEETWQGER
jgi:hypothetical protein